MARHQLCSLQIYQIKSDWTVIQNFKKKKDFEGCLFIRSLLGTVSHGGRITNKRISESEGVNWTYLTSILPEPVLF